MQFNITTDYAIRTVLDLATAETKKTARDIAESMGIPEKYLLKVLKKLAKADIVEVIRGRNGGYILKQSPEDITLYDIAKLTEISLKINCCLDDECNCTRGATDICPVRKTYLKIQDEFERGLKSHTIKEMVNEIV